MKIKGDFAKFIWIIGIEGSGHHLLRAVLTDFLNLSSVVDKGDYYPLWLNRWDVHQAPLPRLAASTTLREAVNVLSKQGETTIFEDTSFPFGPFGSCGWQPTWVSSGANRGPLRMPDILDLWQDLEGSCHRKLVVLYRDPIASVNSALRRGFSNNLAMECRLAEATHLHITSQLRLLPPDSYCTLHFERALTAPEAHIRALGEWCGIPQDLITPGLSHVCKGATPDREYSN